MIFNDLITLEQALAQSPEEFLWSATLRSQEIIFEQPGLSSDHLPRDEVVLIEYIPTRRKDLPVITGRINLDRGERFVRYWTNIWKPSGEGIQRIYCLGIEKTPQVAILGFYPQFNKIVVSDHRPFNPPWAPETFSQLSPGILVRGGPGSDHIEWVHDGFGGQVLTRSNQLVFQAVYQ